MLVGIVWISQMNENPQWFWVRAIYCEISERRRGTKDPPSRARHFENGETSSLFIVVLYFGLFPLFSLLNSNNAPFPLIWI